MDAEAGLIFLSLAKCWPARMALKSATLCSDARLTGGKTSQIRQGGKQIEFQDRRFQPLTHSSALVNAFCIPPATSPRRGLELLQVGLACGKTAAAPSSFPKVTTLEARFEGERACSLRCDRRDLCDILEARFGTAMGHNANRKAPEALWQLRGAFLALRVLANRG